MGPLSLGVLVQPWHEKLQAGGTASRVSQCQPAGISGQKGEIHLHSATLLSPTAAAIRDVAMSTIPTWR